MDLGFGLLNKDGDLEKTDDKIDISTKYGRKAAKNLYYAGLVSFKTQFAEGYDDDNDDELISNFMAPAYLYAALGLDYKPNKSFTFLFSPSTFKLTMVHDQSISDQGAFGVDTGAVVRNEFGAFTRFVYSQSFMDKSISVLSKLDLFSNYLEHPENIDVTWEITITFKFNSLFSTTISSQLIYDDDINNEIEGENDEKIIQGPKIQFKEVIGVGISYKF